jgi:hypothetical protein
MAEQQWDARKGKLIAMKYYSCMIKKPMIVTKLNTHTTPIHNLPQFAKPFVQRENAPSMKDVQVE